MDLEFILSWISVLSFLYYGINSLVSKKMVAEYKRWGFASKRYIIAYSQIFASVGLILGFYNSMLTIISSFFLFLMMIGAMITRIIVKDSFLKTLPSFCYATINFIVFYLSINS